MHYAIALNDWAALRRLGHAVSVQKISHFIPRLSARGDRQYIPASPLKQFVVAFTQNCRRRTDSGSADKKAQPDGVYSRSPEILQVICPVVATFFRSVLVPGVHRVGTQRQKAIGQWPSMARVGITRKLRSPPAYRAFWKQQARARTFSVRVDSRTHDRITVGGRGEIKLPCSNTNRTESQR